MKNLKLYLVESDLEGYDVFDSFIAAAESEEAASYIHPNFRSCPHFIKDADEDTMTEEDFRNELHTWIDFDKEMDRVKVTYIGEAAPHICRGVVLSSFNAS